MKKYIPICIILIISITFLGLHNIKEEKELEINIPKEKENSNHFTIASYINGVYSDDMPATSNYYTYVKCLNSSGSEIDTESTATWNNNKWNVSISNITASSKCNVYFLSPPNHWDEAESGSLLYALKRDNTIAHPLTRPGKETSLENEAVLSATEDDYGTSYYFRGNVQNKY